MHNRTYVGHLSDAERLALDVQHDPGALGIYGGAGSYDEFAADLEGVSAEEVERRWQSGGKDPFADDYEGL